MYVASDYSAVGLNAQVSDVFYALSFRRSAQHSIFRPRLIHSGYIRCGSIHRASTKVKTYQSVQVLSFRWSNSCGSFTKTDYTVACFCVHDQGVLKQIAIQRLRKYALTSFAPNV